MHVRGETVLDGDGKAVRMSGTVQDVTDRKNVELKLQETVERYTSLKKYNHDAVFSLDLQGRVHNTNQMAERLTGYVVADMVGVTFARFIGEEHLKEILTHAEEDRTAEQKIDKIRHRDGHSVEVLTTIAPIVINGETVGYYIIAKDITEQKRLVLAKDAAESMNKAKSEFLAMMSHEIRTPMNGVIGMTDLLLTTTDLDPQQREYVAVIRKSGETLLAIINEILDLSKIEAGKIRLEESPLDVRQVLAETLDILKPRWDGKGLGMTVSVEETIPCVLRGDPARLKQVFLNIIGNAVKFTDSGEVSVSVQRAGGERGEFRLKVTVRDTGIGIPEDKREHLFEPFYQLDQFMLRKSEGSGLGLAISRRLVELMGGEIWAEPVKGPGATFVFTVVVKQEEAGGTSGTAVENPEEPEGQKGLSILVAEDNEVNRLVLQKMLEKLGQRVRLVENGKEAVEEAVRNRYDLIFMDVRMPVMSGLEATRLLKEKLPPEGRPVIVAVTANALKETGICCLPPAWTTISASRSPGIPWPPSLSVIPGRSMPKGRRAGACGDRARICESGDPRRVSLPAFLPGALSGNFVGWKSPVYAHKALGAGRPGKPPGSRFRDEGAPMIIEQDRNSL
ncbi:ATP-binding protein [Paenibacillus sp. CC-CFT747]|nr:ATP-binding protein [Paenibacillus sp. CC-CFT747]